MGNLTYIIIEMPLKLKKRLSVNQPTHLEQSIHIGLYLTPIKLLRVIGASSFTGPQGKWQLQQNLHMPTLPHIIFTHF